MGQKIFPRSLRSHKLLGQDFSLYSEQAYANLWAKGFEVWTLISLFGLKNLRFQAKKRLIGTQKKNSKRKKLPHYLDTRLNLSKSLGVFQVCPILFKFAHKSVSKKYNPLKKIQNIRRTTIAPKKMTHRNTFLHSKKSASLPKILNQS